MALASESSGSASRGAIGGASGDAGVEYRRAVAAFAVVYGLSSLPLLGFGFSGSQALVATVSLETDSAVDDIRVDFTSGASAFVQAKRHLRDGPQFASAVDQWRRAAEGGLDVSRDRLVIVAGSLSGPMRRLQALLLRYSDDTIGGLTCAEAEILARVDARLGGLHPDQRAALLRCASILDLDVEEPGSSDARAATALLAGKVCTAADAGLAWRTLIASAGQLARRRTGWVISSWQDELRAANVSLLTSGDTRSAQLERTFRAVESYKSELCRAAGMIDLRPLGATLSPIAMDAADAGVSVHLGSGESREKQDLAWVALRRGRVVLTGLPGGGKSTAMANAAAQLTGLPRAPLPVFASLKDMFAPQRLGGFRQRLLEVVSDRARSDTRGLLTQAIEDRLDDGRIVLFLDGLDETYERRGKVVAELDQFLQGVNPDVGVVLATRDVAYGQAATLGWSSVRLAKPTKAQALIQAVLQSAGAELHIRDGASRDVGKWVSERSQWVAGVLDRDSTLSETPLLPLLLSLLAVERNTEALPARRAKILLEVVNAVVDRHERHRRERFAFGILEGTDARDAALAGFAVEAAAILARAGQAPVEVISRDVALMLRQRWNLSAGHAASTAREIVRFWDEHGIFVISNSTQYIAPRISLFAEVGDAMKAVETPETLDDWVAERFAAGKLESLILAAGLSPAAATSLATLAADTGDRALVRAVAQAVQEGAAVAPEKLAAVRRILLADARKADRDGWHSWIRALRLADSISWEDALAALDAYPQDYKMLGQACCELAERSADELIQSPGLLLAVLSLDGLGELKSQPPDDRSPKRILQPDEILGDPRPPDLLGDTQLRIGRLLIGRVSRTGQIILDTIGERPMRLYEDFLRLLAENGYADEAKGIRLDQGRRLAEIFASSANFDANRYRRLVAAIADIARPSELTPGQESRMDELADYVETLDLNAGGSWPLMKQAAEQPQILRLACTLGGFDPGVLSAQASLVRERVEATDHHTAFFYLFDRARRRDLDRWHDAGDLAAAVRLIATLFTLGLNSAHVALRTLWNFPQPALAAPVLRELLSQVHSSPRHQWLVAGALYSLRGTPEPQCWLDSGNPVLRAMLASTCPVTSHGSLNPTLSRLFHDDDGTVRAEAVRLLHKGRVPGRRALLTQLSENPNPGWMCWECRTPNPAGQQMCLKDGCRYLDPDPRDTATRLLKGEPPPQSVHRMAPIRIGDLADPKGSVDKIRRPWMTAR